jgi:biotin synthase
MRKESPEYLRLSTAAAIVLGFKNGLFYRNARLWCINLLLTYEEGCKANCAYCGLARLREGDYLGKSFIRVTWPRYPTREIFNRIKARENSLKRVCLSMITHHRALKDTLSVIIALTQNVSLPLSLLATPSLFTKSALIDFKTMGVERLGVALDTATKELFERYRGEGVNGAHAWNRYWEGFEEALSVFGKGKVGIHLIVGLGETEQEMVSLIQEIYTAGGRTHLFSFYPEPGSLLSQHSPPSIGQYRRIQLARFLIDTGKVNLKEFKFDSQGRIKHFGLSQSEIEKLIEEGTPFITSGCPGEDGQVACTRPYGNSPPGESVRNFPFPLEKEDIERVKREIASYS